MIGGKLCSTGFKLWSRKVEYIKMLILKLASLQIKTIEEIIGVVDVDKPDDQPSIINLKLYGARLAAVLS